MNLNGSVFWCFSVNLRYTSRLAFATELLRSNLSPADSSREAASSYLPSAVNRSTLDQLSFRHAEVVDHEFCVVCTGEMFEALQVRPPIADVLIIQRNRSVKVLVTTPPQIVLCFDLLSVCEGQLSKVVVNFS
jgi:hypothetical protein